MLKKYITSVYIIQYISLLYCSYEYCLQPLCILVTFEIQSSRDTLKIYLTMRIAVLYGGWSEEREISIASGNNVAKCLKEHGHDVTLIDVKKNLKEFTDNLYSISPDYIYNAMHGTGAEDGVIQGVLEMYGKPYSNSDVLGSAISFSKSVAKTLVASAGVKVASGITLQEKELYTTKMPMSPPFVVKPDQNGSSIGVHIIQTEQDFDNLKKEKWKHGSHIIIEQFIDGDEFTVAMHNGNIIGHVKIVPAHKFYDYSSKYDTGGSMHINEQLSDTLQQKLYLYSKKAYKSCRCQDLVRIDFKICGENVTFIEINTQPGMTATSLVPDIAKNNGVDLYSILISASKREV